MSPHHATLAAYTRLRSGVVAWRARADQRGEGVISAAIAVLIMAFLGAGMWLAFSTIFNNTARNTCEQTAKIGGTENASSCAGVGGN